MLFKTQILEHCFILMLIHETPLSVVDKHQEQIYQPDKENTIEPNNIIISKSIIKISTNQKTQ